MLKIQQIYQTYKTPPNLQEHMQRVREVVSEIEKYWVGEKVDFESLKQIALIHDLGNIVRFDFDKHPEFLGEEIKRIDYWKDVKAEIISKYGDDDHVVTQKMFEKMGVDGGWFDVVSKKSFRNSVEIADSNNWTVKILYYADMRTMPFGFCTIEERIEDIKSRRPDATSDPNFEKNIIAMMEIENQIQEKVNVDLDILIP